MRCFKFGKILETLLPTRTFVITTQKNTKFIKITSLMQLFFIVASLSLVMFFTIKYRIYVNNGDLVALIEENNFLKKERKQFEDYYIDISSKIDRINEYIEVDKDTSKKKKIGLVGLSGGNFNVDNVKVNLNDKINYSYDALTEKSKNIAKIVNRLGIERISYNKIQKIAKVSPDADSDLIASANISGQEENVSGGPLESVKTITITESRPILPLPAKKITDKNFDKEIDRMIKIKEFINVLPIGVPTKDEYRIGSKFGIRQDPFKHTKAVHRGLDIIISTKKIHTPAKGKVVFVGTKSGYGNVIEIEHNYNNPSLSVKTRYAHLNKPLVKVGDIVDAKQLIAIEGSTGRSTGDHLHFETLIQGQHVNPLPFIQGVIM